MPRAVWRMHAQSTLLDASTLPVDGQGDYTPSDTRFAGDCTHRLGRRAVAE